MAKQIETAAEKYRRSIASSEPEIVDVVVPSGNVFKFEKPSKFAMLFGLGDLPTEAASMAVANWNEQGVISLDPTNKPLVADQEKAVKVVFDLRDKVLRLSHDPKLVMGPATAPNELSTEDVSDADLTYLFKWVSAGGVVSAMLANFPEGRELRPVAHQNRKARRAAAK